MRGSLVRVQHGSSTTYRRFEGVKNRLGKQTPVGRGGLCAGLFWRFITTKTANRESHKRQVTKTQIDRLGGAKERQVTDDDLRLLDEYRRSFSSAYKSVIAASRYSLGQIPIN